MPQRTLYSSFQFYRIGAGFEHGLLVVSFYDEIIGASDILQHFVCEMPDICHQHERDAFCLNAIADIILTVVWYPEGSNGKIAHMKRLSFLYNKRHILGYLGSHTPVLLYAFVHFARGIYRNMIIFAHTTHGFHMISMIV